MTREEVANFVARTADTSAADTTDIEASVNMSEIEETIADEVTPDNLEHLQLTLPEAFFLLWSLDCLRVLDSNTVCRTFI